MSLSLSRTNKARLVIIILIIVSILLYRWFFYYFTYTRDAYVFANVVSINSVVSGQIIATHVKDNQQVKQGQLLVQIDPRPYQDVLAKAQSELQSAMRKYNAARDAITAAQAAIAEKQAALAKAQDHLRRYTELLQTQSIAQINVENTRAQVQTEKAAVAYAKQQFEIAKQKYNKTDINNARAKVNLAQYDLEHTRVVAPTDGYVTNYFLRVGGYVKVGQALFALVDNTHWWVIGRFRETVLRRIAVGDHAKVFVDMYPWHYFDGKVDSIGWGINRRQASNTAADSSLAYLKPTEDWVRIAQRFPVRILLSTPASKYPLRVGASATTYVEPASQ